MKGFQLSRYLKKWLPLIIIFFVAATAGACYLLMYMQSYTASAVIEYTNEEAKEGLAPDGTQIDLTEINSSANMARVMDALGLGDSDIYTLDQLCASISVEPIVEEQSILIQEAMNEEGEEYTDKPTAYIVSCTLYAPASEALVRDILNETLDVYFEDYGNKHISQGEISNVTKHFPDSSYDYLEMVEEIDTALNTTIESLDQRYNKDTSFRSTATGYSFSDLSDRFTLLREVNIFRLYSQILGNQITKDKEVLLAKYRSRIASYELSGEKAMEDIEEAERIIDAYVQKMRESGNTEIDAEYILNDVYGYEDTNENGERKMIDRSVEYDTLLSNWVGYKNTLDYAIIDRAYCRFIIGVYEDSTGNNLFSSLLETGSAEEDILSEAAAEETAAVETAAAEAAPVEEEDIRQEGAGTAAQEAMNETDAAAPETASVQIEGETVSEEILEQRLSKITMEQVTSAEVEAEIAEVVTEMNRLYEISSITNQEFNEYLGARGIQTLSSTSVEARFNLKLYVVLIAVCFLVVGCGGAIMLGRIGDILEYLFLTDRQTGCMNRVSCDNYIRRYEKKTLSSGFCCIYLQLQNQRELNKELGREEADMVLKKIADILKEIPGSRRGGFTGYNGGGQFWSFYEAGPRDETLSQTLDHFVSVMEDSFSRYAVVYAMGGVNAGEEKVYQIRSLISKATVKKEVHTTIPAPSDSGEKEE